MLFLFLGSLFVDVLLLTFCFEDLIFFLEFFLRILESLVLRLKCREFFVECRRRILFCVLGVSRFVVLFPLGV